MMRLITISFLLLLTANSIAQEAFVSVEDQMEQIRYLAFEEDNYDGAIELAKLGYKIHHDSHQIGIMLSRLFFWSGNIEAAKESTNELVMRFPDSTDAVLLKLDLLESQGEIDAAYDFISEIETRFPNSEMIQYRKAYNLSLLSEYDVSEDILKRIVKENPEFEKARNLLNEIKNQTTNQFVALGYNLFTPVDELVSLQQYELSYGREVDKSVFVAKLNVREIVGERGLQGQLEWYRKINKNIYSHTYFAFGNSDLLAKVRFGAGLYFEYKNGMKYSLTASHLKATSTSINFYSAGIQKRMKQIELHGKLFYTDDEESASEFSYLFGARRYLNKHDMYAGVSYGLVPQTNLQILQQPDNLLARFVGLEFFLPVRKEYEFKLQYNINIRKFAVQRDQLMFMAKYNF